jgi:hypothetical protein
MLGFLLFIWPNPLPLSHRGAPACKEVENQKDYTRDEHDVNQTGGNVKCEKVTKVRPKLQLSFAPAGQHASHGQLF